MQFRSVVTQDGNMDDMNFRQQYALVGQNQPCFISNYLTYFPENQDLNKHQLMVPFQNSNETYQNFHVMHDYRNLRVTGNNHMTNQEGSFSSHAAPIENSKFPEIQRHSKFSHSQSGCEILDSPSGSEIPDSPSFGKSFPALSKLTSHIKFQENINQCREVNRKVSEENTHFFKLDTNDLGKLEGSDKSEITLLDNLCKTENSCMHSGNESNECKELIKCKSTIEPSLRNVKMKTKCLTYNVKKKMPKNMFQNTPKCKCFKESFDQERLMQIMFCSDAKSKSTEGLPELFKISKGGTEDDMQSNMFKCPGQKKSLLQKTSISYSAFCRSCNSLFSIWNNNEKSSYTSPFLLQENTILHDLSNNVSLLKYVPYEESEVNYNYFEDPEFQHHAKSLLELVED